MANNSLNDYMLAYFKSMVDGLGPTLFGTINTNPTAALPVVQQVDDITNFGGDIAAPGAGTVIASVNIPAAGTYDITFYTNLSGTTAGNDRPNLQVFKNGVGGPVIISTMGGITDRFRQRMVFTGAGTVSVKNIAAATAASVYRTTIVANRQA